MAVVTKTGTIKSTSHTKESGTHQYSFMLDIVTTNPSPPPATITTTVDFNPCDKEFYDDAVGAGTSSVTLVYDEADPGGTLKGFTITR